jgi:hypothetical protein
MKVTPVGTNTMTVNFAVKTGGDLHPHEAVAVLSEKMSRKLCSVEYKKQTLEADPTSLALTRHYDGDGPGGSSSSQVLNNRTLIIVSCIAAVVLIVFALILAGVMLFVKHRRSESYSTFSPTGNKMAYSNEMYNGYPVVVTTDSSIPEKK